MTEAFGMKIMWTCDKCGWVNIGHLNYCTACLLSEKKPNWERIRLAVLHGKFIRDTDDVGPIN